MARSVISATCVADADEIRELVEHLDVDDGRIHVGDEQLLRRLGRRLNADIDRPARADRARSGRSCRGRVGRVEGRCRRRCRAPASRRAGTRPVAQRARDRAVARAAGERAARRPRSAIRGEDSSHGARSWPMTDDRLARRGRRAPVVLIAGPTASGKSALALALAERFGGAIINADSMQVYRELRILTARPDAGRRGARAASRSTAVSCRRALLGAALARRWRSARSPRRGRRAGCRSSSAAPGSISRRCTGAGARCRRSPPERAR